MSVLRSHTRQAGLLTNLLALALLTLPLPTQTGEHGQRLQHPLSLTFQQSEPSACSVERLS